MDTISNSHGFFIELELRDSKLGKSLFTKEFIKQGSIIWEDKSIDVVSATKEDIISWPEEQRKTFCDYSWQVDDNLFIGTYNKEKVNDDASNFINHSCDPSCWFVTDKHISARRDIYPGEEITIDYATTDTIFVTIPDCRCESPNCRKSILPTDYKLPEVQKAYGNHFRFFLLRRMLNEAPSGNGIGIMFELHPHVKLMDSHIHGRGLYASSSIKAGTLVWEANEAQDDIWIELDEADISDLDRDFYKVATTYFEMNEKGKYRGPKFAESIERDASNFFNHSCNPNLWFVGDDRLFATRDIKAGEELVYDYCTAKRLYHKTFPCHCKAKNCRKVITYEDYKLEHLRKKYADHWVSHWLKLMEHEAKVAADFAGVV